MSRDNVERHRRALDAVNRRDLDALLVLMDDDVDAVSRIVAMEGGLRGHEGIRRWWEGWLDAFPDYAMEVGEVLDTGDATVAAIRGLGHGAGSAMPVEDVIWQAARWRDGKCVWWRTFYTREEALQAVGVSE
jgi:ketosteroid isomerase-like protein